MNKAIIVGNLGSDPEMKFTANGMCVMRLRVATNDRVKRNGEWQNEATWHTVTVFGKRAEGLNKFLSKGHTVAVTGRIENRTYEKKDGTKGFTTQILADDVEAISRPQSSHGGRNDSGDGYTPSNNAGASGTFSDDFSDDDIPF